MTEATGSFASSLMPTCWPTTGCTKRFRTFNQANSSDPNQLLSSLVATLNHI